MANKHNTIGKGTLTRAVNGGKDQYFTPAPIAHEFTQLIAKYAPQNAQWIEPAAGGGVFLRGAKAANITAKGYDLEPQGAGITAQDFFTFTYNKSAPAVVFGNPPFGFAASLAVRFFNHAATFAHTIAFILPASFCKASVQNRLDPHFVCKQETLQRIAFELPDGKTKSVPCTLQIWQRLPGSRTRKKLAQDDGTGLGLQFLKPAPTKAPRKGSLVLVRRVGGRAGQIVQEGSENTTYFIFCDAKTKAAIARADFSAHLEHTAGVRSLSKPELLAAIRAAL